MNIKSSEVVDDPFACLVTPLSVPDGRVNEDLLFDLEPIVKKRKPKKRSKAQLEALTNAPVYLFGPDSRLNEELGYEPAESAYTYSEFRPKRKIRDSSLPLAVLTSSSLADARSVCDHLATVRAGIPEAKTSNPTNSWLDAADLLIRVDGFNVNEIKAVIDYFAARGSLGTWIKAPFILRDCINEALCSGMFSLWLIKNNRDFSGDKIIKAKGQGVKNVSTFRSKTGLIAAPNSVKDADHATGGRREVTF